MQTVLIPADAVRRTETAAATMTTLASPTLSGSVGLSLWRVEMNEGTSGPPHRIDSQQIWTLLTGEATFLIAGTRYDLSPGDTIQAPADVERSVSAQTPATFLVCGRGDALASSPSLSQPITPSWIA